MDHSVVEVTPTFFCTVCGKLEERQCTPLKILGPLRAGPSFSAPGVSFIFDRSAIAHELFPKYWRRDAFSMTRRHAIFFSIPYSATPQKMTWDEGLSYVAAERTERKMREEALVTSHIAHPPRMPLPFDARMTDSSSAFEDVVTEAAMEEESGEEAGGGISAKAQNTASSSSQRPQRPMTYRQWFDAQKEFDLYALSTPDERRMLRRRMERGDCKWRQTVSEDPSSYLIFGAIASALVGIALGSSIVASSRHPAYRGKMSPPPACKSPASTERRNPFFRKATPVQQNTVEKIMTFLR